MKENRLSTDGRTNSPGWLRDKLQSPTAPARLVNAHTRLTITQQQLLKSEKLFKFQNNFTINKNFSKHVEQSLPILIHNGKDSEVRYYHDLRSKRHFKQCQMYRNDKAATAVDNQRGDQYRCIHLRLRHNAPSVRL